MSKKHDIEYVRNTIYEIAGYILLDDVYLNNRTKMTAIDKDGYKYYFTLENLKFAKAARMVDKSNPYSIENIKLWLKNNDLPYELLSTEYKGNGSKDRKNCLLKFCCKNGHIFYRTWNDVCCGHMQCDECIKRFNDHEQFVLYINNKYKGEYEILGQYINSSTKIKVKHVKCGTVFYIRPESLANGHGCPNSLCCKKHGEEHYRYNKNLSDEDRFKDRDSKKEYRDWRSAVYEKYDFSCDICKNKSSKNNKIVAHHLESYDINEDLRYELQNGVALCERCHVGFHKKYGFGKNTAKQYREYKNNYDNIEVRCQIS